MAVYFIRHGETDWNRAGRLQGTTDVPLNKERVRQARRLARRLCNLRVAAVFASPLSRAWETARIIARARSWPAVPDNELREIDHGIWTGMTTEGIARNFPEEYAVLRLRPHRLQLSRGERLQESYRRAATFLSRILTTRFDGDVLVVSHGVINALFLCAALDVAISRAWEFPQPNGCIRVLQVRDGRITGFEALKDVSD